MNFKVRLRNPLFYVMILGALIMPVLAYMNMELKDLTTWAAVGEIFATMFKNPFVLGTVFFSVFNALVDPTTQGVQDSKQVMRYWRPKRKGA